MTTAAIVVFITTLVGIGVWVAFIFKYRKHWVYAVIPLSYLIHVLLLYTSSALHLLEPLDLNTWSNAVRLHGVLLVVIMGMLTITGRWKWTLRY